MNTTLWIIAGLLFAAYLAGGVRQILMTKDQLRAAGASQDWVEEFSDGHINAIGTIKMVGAIGLVLPALFDATTVLVPLAACGLMLFMAGAATIRFRRSEWLFMVGDVAFLAAFAFLAWGRFTLEPFN